MKTYDGSFGYVHRGIGWDLARHARKVEVPTWHAENVEGNPMLVSHELAQVSFTTPIPGGVEDAQRVTGCQMPWAEDHFQERVSGKPLNPPPSADYWLKPGQADKHRTIEEDGVMKYSHSYPERFWPREAGSGQPHHSMTRAGIRFDYGDLGDVVDLLHREPLTRQAYLPVWFPEDTGAVHRERVPCTLGYHFMIREALDITYMIRSVDYVRHFHDDVYMAFRLAQWMRAQLNTMARQQTKPRPSIGVGYLHMHVMSMHAFEGDMPKLRRTHGAD